MSTPLSVLQAAREKIAEQRTETAANRVTSLSKIELLKQDIANEEAHAADLKQAIEKAAVDLAEYDSLIAQLTTPQAAAAPDTAKAEVIAGDKIDADLVVALPPGFKPHGGGASPFGVFDRVDVVFADGGKERIFGKDLEGSWLRKEGHNAIVGYHKAEDDQLAKAAG